MVIRVHEHLVLPQPQGQAVNSLAKIPFMGVADEHLRVAGGWLARHWLGGGFRSD